MPGIASSAPAVLLAHVASVTSSIRVGSGGVMLPNHSSLVVAEQFGMLEALHPGRVDLGIGRAPGTDQLTAHALRRAHTEADDFPEQLVELIGYFESHWPAGHPFRAITATPGLGYRPEIWMLGSSYYGAHAAGLLGLPYSFAHHFSGANTMEAVRTYREAFRPGGAIEAPYLMLGVSVVCAETDEHAQWLAAPGALSFVRMRSGRPGRFPTPEEAAAYELLSARAGVAERAHELAGHRWAGNGARRAGGAGRKHTGGRAGHHHGGPLPRRPGSLLRAHCGGRRAAARSSRRPEPSRPRRAARTPPRGSARSCPFTQRERGGSCLGEAGLARFKLYFMVGLPGEEDDDVYALATLATRIKERLDAAGNGTRLVIAVSPLVPKPWTAYQYETQFEPAVITARQGILKQHLAPGIEFRTDSPQTARIDDVLSRGDGRVAAMLAELPDPSLGSYKRAIREHGLDGARPWAGEAPPWHVVDVGMTERFLLREMDKHERTRRTIPCPPPEVGCKLCGVC